MASASGLTSITARSSGPRMFVASMRARYFSVIDRDVSLPGVESGLEIGDRHLLEIERRRSPGSGREQGRGGERPRPAPLRPVRP